jgi:ribosomal protein L11 methyltransferase
MDYYQYNFIVTPTEPGSDILISAIADSGFESFELNEKGFLAYIPENLNDNLNLAEFVFDDFKFLPKK